MLANTPVNSTIGFLLTGRLNQGDPQNGKSVIICCWVDLSNETSHKIEVATNILKLPPAPFKLFSKWRETFPSLIKTILLCVQCRNNIDISIHEKHIEVFRVYFGSMFIEEATVGVGLYQWFSWDLLQRSVDGILLGRGAPWERLFTLIRPSYLLPVSSLISPLNSPNQCVSFHCCLASSVCFVITVQLRLHVL